MIVAKTPLRLPFAGGLSDIREYADRYGGLTISATIDKYIYVALKPHHERGFELRYLNAYEKVDKADEIRHAHIREAIKLCGLEGEPLELAVMNDLPHEGGLGSSGALSCALISALYAYKGEAADDERVVADATRLEMDILAGASGYHDHAITQLGGLRALAYEGGKPRPVELGAEAETIRKFLKRFMLFYSGYHAKTRPSLVLLAEHFDDAKPTLDSIKHNALELAEALATGDQQKAAACVRRQQELKQTLPGAFQNDFVVETMRRAERLGVYAQIPGGKIGSFLMVYRPKGLKRKKVAEHFGDLRPIPFSFVDEGTKVVRL